MFLFHLGCTCCTEFYIRNNRDAWDVIRRKHTTICPKNIQIEKLSLVQRNWFCEIHLKLITAAVKICALNTERPSGKKLASSATLCK